MRLVSASDPNSKNAVRAPAGLNWPAPHHMRMIDPGAGAEGERGMVTLNNGEKLLRTVLRIDFEVGERQFWCDDPKYAGMAIRVTYTVIGGGLPSLCEVMPKEESQKNKRNQ
jgi:hypothetical protein